VCGVCGRCGGVGSLLMFDIPQTALVATLDTYDFNKFCDRSMFGSVIVFHLFKKTTESRKVEGIRYYGYFRMLPFRRREWTNCPNSTGTNEKRSRNLRTITH
jgi:hypothetical protein